MESGEPRRRVRAPQYSLVCANPWCGEPFKAKNADALYHSATCRKIVERERKQALRVGREPFGGLLRDTPKGITPASRNKPEKIAPDLLVCEPESQVSDQRGDRPRTGRFGLGYYSLLCGNFGCFTRQRAERWKVPTRQLPDGSVWLCPKCRHLATSNGGN